MTLKRSNFVSMFRGHAAPTRVFSYEISMVESLKLMDELNRQAFV